MSSNQLINVVVFFYFTLSVSMFDFGSTTQEWQALERGSSWHHHNIQIHVEQIWISRLKYVLVVWPINETDHKIIQTVYSSHFKQTSLLELNITHSKQRVLKCLLNNIMF